MIILGINAYHADSSAAILVNGKLIAAIEEERLERKKHWAGFPEKSIEFCLKEAGIELQDVDYIAIGRDPKAKFANKLIYLAKNPVGSYSAIGERIMNSRKVASIENDLADFSGLKKSAFEKKIVQVEHHRSHLASSFFASPFEEAACVSIDGSGDFTTTMTAIGKGNQIKILDSIDFPHSLGLFYTAFTQLLGFPHYGDEYKVMGMAPYGEPKYVDKLQQLIHLKDDGLFQLDLSFFRKASKGFISYGKDHVPLVAPLFNDKMISVFGAVRVKGAPLEQYHKDLAASVQKMTEQTIFHILNAIQRKTGMENLCLAGGVIQNSVANGKIIDSTGFQNIYIPPAAHDAGIAIGAALYVHNQLYRKERIPAIRSAYTGSHSTNDEIKNYLISKGIHFSELPDEILFNKITDCLVKGGVVGWFSGRAEFGPRALGGRSILADPRRADAKEILNSKIKRRETFRPFAPSILKEFTSEYFHCDEEVPFMEKVSSIRKEKRKEIPAVTHVDGSGRLQTVDQLTSPRYYGLIENFRNKTGIPILLNTSFNENEPIVNSPEDALNCFLRTEMDMLAMENILISRDNNGRK
ncbi:MAG: carbamoyltransferase family protein [Ginsengibacter sp.]